VANIRVNDRVFLGALYGCVAVEQCEKLHCASLEILERTGVRLHLQEAVDLLAGAGAFVSEQKINAIVRRAEVAVEVQ
jgi:trimethylamine:corrinoid methyltransferase-like protein